MIFWFREEPNICIHMHNPCQPSLKRYANIPCDLRNFVRTERGVYFIHEQMFKMMAPFFKITKTSKCRIHCCLLQMYPSSCAVIANNANRRFSVSGSVHHVQYKSLRFLC